MFCIWFNQRYVLKQFRSGQKVMLSGTVQIHGGRRQLAHPDFEFPADEKAAEGQDTSPGLHTGRLVPVYPLTQGIGQHWLRRLVHETLEAVGDDLPETLPEREGWVDREKLHDFSGRGRKPQMAMAKRFGRYETLRPIASGGMATVYRARDQELGRDVAIKMMHPHLAKRPEYAERFRREARAVAALHHPNIIEIYSYSGLDSPETWLVTEFVDGPDLKRFLGDHPIRLPHVAALVVLLLALGDKEDPAAAEAKVREVAKTFLAACMNDNRAGAEALVDKLTPVGPQNFLGRAACESLCRASQGDVNTVHNKSENHRHHRDENRRQRDAE